MEMNWKLIEELLRKAGSNQSKFAKKIGKSRQVVSRWFSGRNDAPWWVAFELAKFLEISPMDMVSGLNGPAETGIPIVGRCSTGRVDIPLWIDSRTPPREGVFGNIESPFIGREIFAVLVDSDSMSPRYESGDTVIVNTDLEFIHGQAHLVRLSDGRSFLQVVKRQSTGYKLESINQAHPSMYVEAEQIAFIYRVTATIHRRRI